MYVAIYARFVSNKRSIATILTEFGTNIMGRTDDRNKFSVTP